MKYLLDTDTCIAAMRGRSGAIAKLSAIPPDECAVSAVTVYELAVGVAKCREPQREAAKVTRFLAQLHVLPLETAAARQAGTIRAGLEERGESIGPYDVLLAGQAMAHGLRMISGNIDEFARVPGLHLESW